MPQFTYVGKNRDGENVSGFLEAVDEFAARAALRDLQIDVQEVHDSGVPPSVLRTQEDLQREESTTYAPLVETLQLYAGWLFACLFLILTIGHYQLLRHLPWRSDLLDEWIRSSLIQRVTVVAFLFLFLSSIHRIIGRGLWKGIGLAIIGFTAIAFFMANA